MKKIFAGLLMVVLFAALASAELPTISLNSIDPTTVAEGQAVVVNLSQYVTYSGPDSDLSFTMTPSTPGSITNGVYRFSTNADSAGTYNMQFTVRNGTNTGGSDTLRIVVTEGSAGIGMTDIMLGGPNQQRGRDVTSTITITNNGPAAITGVSVSVQGAASELDLAISDVSATSIPAGGSITATISGFVPLDMDAVDSDGSAVQHNVGTVTVSGTSEGNSVTSRKTVLMQAENNLRIDDGDLVVDEDSEGIDDGDSIDIVKPGDEVEIVLTLENTFDDSGECDEDSGDCAIEDIEGTVVIDDGDLDIDEDFDSDDIDADDTSEVSVTFEIDSDIDEDTYEMVIEVTGIDENGARHGDRWEIELEIEKEEDEITITDVTIDPSVLSCEEQTARVTVEVENSGSKDQSKTVVDIRNTRLNIFATSGIFDLDEGDDAVRTFSMRIPTSAQPGTYYLEVTSFYDNDEESDSELVQFTIEECDDEVTPRPPRNNTTQPPRTNSTDVVYVGELPNIPDGAYYGQPQGGNQVDFFDSPAYILLLGIGVLIAFLLVVILIVMLVRK